MKKIYIISLLLSLFALSACNSNPSGCEQITFNSMLPGAKVYVDDTLIGETPCAIILDSYNSYEVKFERNGFKPESYTLTPSVQNLENSTLVNNKYKTSLSPKNIVAEMKPECLPILPGKTAFETFTENYIKVDALRKFGAITDAEYKYMVSYMNEFYGQEEEE